MVDGRWLACSGVYHSPTVSGIIKNLHTENSISYSTGKNRIKKEQLLFFFLPSLNVRAYLSFTRVSIRRKTYSNFK